MEEISEVLLAQLAFKILECDIMLLANQAIYYSGWDVLIFVSVKDCCGKNLCQQQRALIVEKICSWNALNVANFIK